MASVNRPLSPHLGIWRWRVHMLVSILHRATGDGLAIGGTLLFLWWLVAAATGPEAYETFLSIASGWVGITILVALTWAVYQHMMSGIRHLAMDTGWGYDLATSKLTAILTILASLTLTAITWALILYV
ncbi:succinate dehydrogenase, cytochrome b556 subunit [Sphingosinicella sp.]|uniref:succinate dehydrogenase, cytochrome b556 subunit n=1 Tax=Sphingosinicella sp. TaxID=1917971 RepID=UPI0017E2E34E|nr:succinate dehydrogenase, cytochrome b556 subunit [Sphingosinicella sp.]MBA4759499.1 succinate dehydrogenase, cytochrome b556 subunit [Sphingosinicella sp.]MEA3540147.1 succinate dehydrogenase, cytochrome b556 subunit [Pseudomonadota bacterium]